MSTSVDKCSGDECICKSLPHKVIDPEVARKVWPRLVISGKRQGCKTPTEPSVNIQMINISGPDIPPLPLFGGFPPPAAGGAAMRMAMAREVELVRMKREGGYS